MVFDSIASFNSYSKLEPPKHQQIDLGRYPDDYLLSSPPIYPNFYRISLKYGLEEKKDKGFMYFSSPNQEVSWHSENPLRGFYLQITEDLIQSHQHLKYSFLTYGLHEPLDLKKEEEQIISNLFSAALIEFGKAEVNEGMLVSYFNLIFTYVSQFYERQFAEKREQNNRLVNDFFMELGNYYQVAEQVQASQPSVASIAARLNVTPNYLSDLVKYYTGKSALAQIHQHIIDNAKTLLKKPELSISEIAYQLGFEYPNYFSRLFRKSTGLTPSKFREQ